MRRLKDILIPLLAALLISVPIYRANLPLKPSRIPGLMQILVPIVAGTAVFTPPTRISTCHGQAVGTNGGVNTSSLNCTGATLFVIELGNTFASAATCGPPIDSSSNTWTAGPTQVSGSNVLYDSVWYVYNPTVSSTQTFKTTTCTGGTILHVTGYTGGAWLGSIDGAGQSAKTNGSATLGFGTVALGTGSGTYTSGGTISSGTTGNTCNFTLSGANYIPGTGGTGNITLTGPTTIAGGSALNVTVAALGEINAPNAAGLSSGTGAVCSSTATVATTLTYYAPATSNEVCVASLAISSGSALTITGSGWTAGDNANSNGTVNQGLLSAYMLAPTGGTGLNPSWSWVTSTQAADISVCFK